MQEVSGSQDGHGYTAPWLKESFSESVPLPNVLTSVQLIWSHQSSGTCFGVSLCYVGDKIWCSFKLRIIRSLTVQVDMLWHKYGGFTLLRSWDLPCASEVDPGNFTRAETEPSVMVFVFLNIIRPNIKIYWYYWYFL